jgi:hypothetical protein
VERLLGPDTWPLRLPIGIPTGRQFANETAAVQRHVQAWQAVTIGEVTWEPVNYRAGAEPVRMPSHWFLRSPSDWAAATADLRVQHEFHRLEHLVEHVDRAFRELLVRQRGLWLGKSNDDVIAAARLAMTLAPGCAEGRPLRLLAGSGVDTKFFERHGGLIARFLDERFHGAGSEQGLAGFLGAREENDHWLLVAPLDEGLLPFRRQRIPASELAHTPLPSFRILIVENEQCLHLLPTLANTIAVLGGGHNLAWLRAGWLRQKHIGYWGDMDTWGLVMLARAREYQPDLMPLMMNQALFDRYASGNAVSEPTVARDAPPQYLTHQEQQFYRYLVGRKHGRLEQEYLPAGEVHRALTRWTGQ